MRFGPDEDTYIPISDSVQADLAWRRVVLEDEIIAVLEEPPPQDEPPVVASRRAEYVLAELFAALNPSDSLELQRRLRERVPTDLLAARFAQLTVERQARLIATLMSSRRRFALTTYED